MSDPSKFIPSRYLVELLSPVFKANIRIAPDDRAIGRLLTNELLMMTGQLGSMLTRKINTGMTAGDRMKLIDLLDRTQRFY